MFLFLFFKRKCICYDMNCVGLSLLLTFMNNCIELGASLTFYERLSGDIHPPTCSHFKIEFLLKVYGSFHNGHGIRLEIGGKWVQTLATIELVLLQHHARNSQLMCAFNNKTMLLKPSKNRKLRRSSSLRPRFPNLRPRFDSRPRKPT